MSSAVSNRSDPVFASDKGLTLMGVMIWLAFFSFNDKTPFRMVISSSLSGSVPSRWNCKKVFNSAFRKLWSVRRSMPDE